MVKKMAKVKKARRRHWTVVFRDRKCLICKKEFKPNGPTSSVCGEKCRKEREAARQKGYRNAPVKKSGKTLSKIPCDICGKVFQPASNAAKYCGSECSMQAKRDTQSKSYKKRKADPSKNGAPPKVRRDIDKLVDTIMGRHTVVEVGMVLERVKIRIREVLLGMEQ